MNLFEESKVPLIPELVKYLNFYGLDRNGKVFHYGDNFYRAITQEGSVNIATALNNGLIAELMSRRLIPYTQVAPYELDGYKFILQHEKIKHISGAHEWSFSMMQDAALMQLDVLEVLLKHGFSSQDSHTGNIMFKDNRPVWVDISSFILHNDIGYWAIEEFFHGVYQPLELMSMNMPMARERLRNWIMNWKEAVKLNLSVKFGLKRQKYFPSLMRRYEKLFRRQGAEKDKTKIVRGIENWRAKIKKLKFQNVTQWSTYQSNWVTADRHVAIHGGGQPLSQSRKYDNVVADKKRGGIDSQSRIAFGDDC